MAENPSLTLIKSPRYRSFILTRLFLTLGFQMQTVIIGWELYNITKDPFSLGLAGLAEAIPAIGVALYAGHAADTYNRKVILQLSLLGLFLSSIGLLATFNGFFGSNITTWVYVFVFTSGLARGFYGPASFSIIFQLVPKSLLARAGTLNSTAWQFAAVIGPALGGFTYGFVGLNKSYIFILGFMLLALASLSRIGKIVSTKSQDDNPILEKLKEGLAFVFNNKVILSALSLDLFSVLFGGATALLPVFANEILKTGPEGLGLLRAAPSFGAVLTMIYLSFQKPIQQVGVVLIRAVAAFGVCMLIFGFSTNFYISLIALFLSGAFDSISVVIRSNILQLQTPDAMRGRVSAVNTIFIGSSNEIGAFESGLAAKLLGTANSVIFGACMTLGIVGFTRLQANQLVKFKLTENQN